MMFKDHEKFTIENAKQEIQSLVRTRNLLYRVVFKQNIVIAGGFFTSVLQNNHFKDIDIFVLNNDVGVYNQLTNGFKEQLDTPAKTADYNSDINSIFDEDVKGPEWSRSEMVAYMHNTDIIDVINNHRTQAQYILTKYKTREELLAHFDYKHCKVSYVPDDDKLYITRETFDCICDKVLKINNEQNSSNNHQYRLTNFMNKGWTLDDKSKEKLADIQREAIKESFNKLKIDAYMKAVNEPGSYTIGEDALKQLGLTAQALQAQILGK